MESLNKNLNILAVVSLVFKSAFALPAAGQTASVDLQIAAAAKQRESTLDAMKGSLEQQKQSVRRQLNSAESLEDLPGSTDFFVTTALIQAPRFSADCEPLSLLEVESLCQRAAKANDLSPDLVRAVMKQESNFRPCAVSSAGAQGLMQLMPGTASDLDVSDPFDPGQNVFGGARFLRKLMDRYQGDLNRTLGAYNAGPANVDEAGGIPNFPETITYVTKIMQELSGNEPNGQAHP